jgi:hypothetical protein
MRRISQTNTRTNPRTTYALITRRVRELRDGLIYDREEECTLMPDRRTFGICTNSALYLQSILGGAVTGYLHAKNPTAEIGVVEGGHDFLVLENFIVDVWASEIYGTPPVVRRSNAKLANKLYGNPDQWRVWKYGRYEKFLPSTPRRKKNRR